jgi:predicted CopG family antitoxin
MEKQKSHKEHWRITQQKYSKDPVEFVQDQRILNFLNNGSTKGLGDVAYFKDKLLSAGEDQSYEQLLCIINQKISKSQLIENLNGLRKEKNIFLSINKFWIYTETDDPTIVEDYDQALFDLVKGIFDSHKIKYYSIDRDKGDNFNFASPVTQFHITKQ